MMMFTMAGSADDQSSESQTDTNDTILDLERNELPEFSHSDETKSDTPHESSSHPESREIEEISFNGHSGVSEVLRLLDEAFVDITNAFLDADQLSWDEKSEIRSEQRPDDQLQTNNSPAECLPEDYEIPEAQYEPIVTFFDDAYSVCCDSSGSDSPNQQYCCDFPSKKVEEKRKEKINANSNDGKEEERIIVSSHDEGEDINSVNTSPNDRHSFNNSDDSEKRNSLLSDSSGSNCGTSDEDNTETPDFIGISQNMGDFVDDYEDNYILFSKIEQLKNTKLSSLTPSIPKQAFRGHGIDHNHKPHVQMHERFLLEKPVTNKEFRFSTLSDMEKPQFSKKRQCVKYGRSHVQMYKKLLMEYDHDEYGETKSQILDNLSKIRSPRIFDPEIDDRRGKSEELGSNEETALYGEMYHLLKSGGRSDNMHFKRLLRSVHESQFKEKLNKYHFSRFEYQESRNRGMDFQRVKKAALAMWDSENNNTLSTFHRQVDTALMYWNDKRNLTRTAMQEIHAQVSGISESAHNLQAPSPLVLFDNEDPLELEREWIWNGDSRKYIVQDVDGDEEECPSEETSSQTSRKRRKARRKRKIRRFTQFCKLLHTQACLSIQKKLENEIDEETKWYTYSLPSSMQLGYQQSAGNENPQRCCNDSNYVNRCPSCRQNKAGCYCSINETPGIIKEKMPSVLSKFEGNDISPPQQDRLFMFFNVVHQFERARTIKELTSRLSVGPKQLGFLHVKKAYYCELLEHLENNTYKTISSQVRQLLDHQKFIMKIKGRRKLELGFSKNYSKFPLYSEVANMTNAELDEYISQPAHPFEGYLLVTPRVAHKRSKMIKQIITDLHEIYITQTLRGFKELDAREFFRGVRNICNFDGWRCCHDFSIAKMDFVKVPWNKQEYQLKRQLLNFLRSSYMSSEEEEEDENASTSQPIRLLDLLVTPMIQQLITYLYETYNKKTSKTSEDGGPRKGSGVSDSDDQRLHDDRSLAVMNFIKKLWNAEDQQEQDSELVSTDNLLAGTENHASISHVRSVMDVCSSSTPKIYENDSLLIGSNKSQSVSFERSKTRLFQS